MPPFHSAPPIVTLSSLSDYATRESESLLYQERLVNAGLHLGGIAYGAHLIIYGACTYYLVKAPRFSWFLQLYTTVLLALASISYGSNVKYGEMVWIDFRGYPDGNAFQLRFANISQFYYGVGPLEFYLSAQQLPIHVAGEVTMILLTLLVDLLVATVYNTAQIYRTYMVWDKNWRIVVIPLAMLAIAIVIAMIRAIAVAYSLPALLSHEVIRKGLMIYWILSFSLNVIVSSLIIGRLFYARKVVRKQLGVPYATVYSRVVVLIIESTALYTLVSVVFVVLFCLDHPAFMLFVVLYPQIQCMSSEAIILLVHRHQRDTTVSRHSGTQERCAIVVETPYRLSVAVKERSLCTGKDETVMSESIYSQDSFGPELSIERDGWHNLPQNPEAGLRHSTLSPKPAWGDLFCIFFQVDLNSAMDTAPCNKFSSVVRQPPHQQPATDVCMRLPDREILATDGSGSHPTPPSNSHQL
ncbi:hypothetical protein BDZ89DRAFT_1035500 [Hymenopellis radicata]|nr:hypothetical protein BDZ89DRAFT_1035500 [Hymenopellis radicata]